VKNLVIGDLHFGTKSNSTQWLEYQIELFKEQIFPIIEENNFDRIIFLGDLTDIRWAIHQQIGIELKNLVRKLSKLVKTQNPEAKIVFIAGNHDYFSPLYEFQRYNSYELLFGKEFAAIHDNLIFVNTEPYLDEDNSLYLPWFYTEEPELFSNVLYEFKDIKQIYCHTDLSGWDVGRMTALKNVKIYAGHIHFEWTNKEYNLYNLGAAMAFNFNDLNQSRYIYVIENGDVVEKIENVTTPTFKRIYNEQIFNDLDEDFFRNSFVQLMINKTNVNKANYIERIKEIKHAFSEKYSVVIKVYDNVYEFENMEFSPIQTNINDYIDKNVPEHLEDKFNKVKDILTNTDEEL
jgi:DNA repair exonuclease SbcCD nuclease subunit